MTRSLFLCLPLLALVAGVLPARQDEPDDDPDDEPEGRVSVLLDPGMHVGEILAARFRDGGKQIVTYGEDNTLRLWEYDGEKKLRQVKVICPPGYGNPSGFALSPGGGRVAVAMRYPNRKKGTADEVVYVLSLPEGQLLRTLIQKTSLIGGSRGTAMAFSRDARTLVVTALNQPLYVWDLSKDAASATEIKGGTAGKLAKGQASHQLGRHSLRGDVALSPDGTRVAWVGDRFDGKKGVAIYETATGKQVGGLTYGYRAAWSPDGKRIATWVDLKYHGAVVHDADGNRLDVIDVPKSAGPPTAFGFGADSRTLLWNPGLVLDVETKKTTTVKANKTLDHGDLSPDGKLVVAGGFVGESNRLVVRDVATGEEQASAVEPKMFTDKDFLVPRWSKDGKAICWQNPPGTGDGLATLDLEKVQLAPTLKKGEAVKAPILDQDGLSLKLKKRALKADLWELFKTGEKDKKDAKPVTFLHSGVPVIHPTFVADKQIMAIQGKLGGTVSVFDAKTGLRVKRLKGGFRPDDKRLGLSPSPNGKYVATFHPERALYVWSPKQAWPFLTVYKRGHDWVVWTNEGYYAATPGGERMVAWKIDAGIDRMPAVETVDRFRKRMYRPDVIAKAFELRDVAAALKALDGKEAKVVDLEKVQPPRAAVKVVKREGNKVTVEVEAVAQGEPITSLRLMLDGRPFTEVKVEDYEKGRDNAKKTWTVTVPEGDHTLDVLARGMDFSSRSEAVAVRGEGKGKRPTLHLLAVGIDKYGGGIQPLNCAVNDAEDLAKAFPLAKNGGLFADCKVHKLTDKEATAKAVIDKLATLRKDAELEDVVVVFFAGHGMKQDGELYLLTHEAKLKDKGKELDPKTALSGKDLAKHLGRIKGNVLLLLDACHSGAMANSFRDGSADAARTFTDDDTGVIVLAAAMGHQVALEKDGNGYFTSAIKEAIEAKVKLPPHNESDGRMYVRHLYAFTADKVENRSGGKQTPFLHLPPRVDSFALRQFDRKK